MTGAGLSRNDKPTPPAGAGMIGMREQGLLRSAGNSPPGRCLAEVSGSRWSFRPCTEAADGNEHPGPIGR